MKKLQKAAALISAAAIICTVITGCGKSDNKKTAEDYSKMFETQNDTQNDEYGAVMKDDKTSFAVPLTYDTKFIDKDAAECIANYFYAVEKKDEKLYRKSTYDFYMDYLIDNVYKDYNYNKKTFVEALYNGMANASGQNFQIQNIEITDYDDDETAVSSIKQAVTDIGKGKLDDKDIQDIAKLSLDFYLKSGGTTYTQTGESAYIIKSDNKWHLITS